MRPAAVVRPAAACRLAAASRSAACRRRSRTPHRAGSPGASSWRWSSSVDWPAGRTSVDAVRGRRRVSQAAMAMAAHTARRRARRADRTTIERAAAAHGGGAYGTGSAVRRGAGTPFARCAERLTLLTVHAHPDDEASKGAPPSPSTTPRACTRCWCAAPAARRASCRTRRCGSPGQPFHGLDPGAGAAKVAELRPTELAESARIIGFDEVVMLGYRDSGMPETPANQNPDSFHQAPLDEATGRLVEVIRRIRPQVDDDVRRRPAAAIRTPITCGCTTSPCWPSTGRVTPTGTRMPASRSSRRSCTTRRGHGPAWWPCTRR